MHEELWLYFTVSLQKKPLLKKGKERKDGVLRSMSTEYILSQAWPGNGKTASACSVSQDYSTSETLSQESWKRGSLKSGDHCWRMLQPFLGVNE